jgi:hypothetical protein
MQRERGRSVGEKEREQPRKVRKMTGDQDVASPAAQPIANPGRRIVRLEIGRRLEFGQRVAGAPERLGRLARAKLAAVPHDIRSRAAGCRLGCRARGLRFSQRGQRPARVDIGADRIGMVNEKKFQ